VKKTRQIKNLEPGFDSIEAEKALAANSGRSGLNPDFFKNPPFWPQLGPDTDI
jgi:hypothetical protein